MTHSRHAPIFEWVDRFSRYLRPLDPEKYREMQHTAVTGFSGGTEVEILLVISWIAILAIVLRLLPSFNLISISPTGKFSEFLIGFSLYILPQILLFMFPGKAIVICYSSLIGIALLTAVYNVFSRKPRKTQSEIHMSKANLEHRDSDKKIESLKSRNSASASLSNLKIDQPCALSYIRASIMIMSTIAILAVDFSPFPRRFAKTEGFGISLMDIGVGTVVASFSTMAARLYCKYFENAGIATEFSLRDSARSERFVKKNISKNTHQNVSQLPSFFSVIRSTFPIAVLGIIRIFLVKSLEYQEHISEYGVHWNFFLTLAMLPVLLHILVSFCGRNADIAGVFILIVYQMFLSQTSLGSWLISEQRDWKSIISLNKEGIISLIGYLSLSSIFIVPGRIYFSSKTRSELWANVIRQQLPRMIFWTLVYYFCKCKLGILPSRRLANLTYVAGVSALTFGQMSMYSLLDVMQLPTSSSSVLLSKPSLLIESISRNQLAFFLFSNILTGLINMSAQTLLFSNETAFATLVLYMLILSGFVYLLNIFDLKFKI
jgi:phosphatidylinositol glycan class W